MSTEKRAYTRVETRLRGYARRVASLNDAPRYTNFAPPMDEDLKDILESDKLPAPLVKLLVHMNKKLDMILSISSLDELRNDFPINVEIFEISGAGVRIRTDEKLTESEALEVVVLLNQFPLQLAGAKGKILGWEEGSKLWRFEFTNIREPDLEAIIQYVFQEQRQKIRQDKWS